MRSEAIEDLKEALSTRDKEIIQYLDLIERLEKFESCDIHKWDSIDVHIKISKSACYLLFYNTIEYICREIFVLIDDTIRTETQNYSLLTPHFKGVFLKRIRKSNLSESQLDLLKKDILINMIKSFELDPKSIFSGNIEHKIIIETLKNFGINGFKPSKISRSGSDLGVIRDKRNMLAHGEKSFVEAQQEEKLSSELREKWERVRTYLNDLIERCGSAINQSYFLAAEDDE